MDEVGKEGIRVESRRFRLQTSRKEEAWPRMSRKEEAVRIGAWQRIGRRRG